MMTIIVKTMRRKEAGSLSRRNYTQRHHRRRRSYSWKKKRSPLHLLLIALLGGLLIFSLWQLISYGVDYLNAQRTSAELRTLYYAPDPESPAPQPTPSPTAEPTSPPMPEILSPVSSPLPTAAANLPTLRYPTNYYAAVNSRFQKLQRQNEDIIGWLTIEDLLDEAVVQRDNSYYLRRDYRGYHNTNGAIFLEETCNLKTRPYTMILYGHNMKTGEMFGFLRNYENANYYHTNPFITFDTVYEDGQYVILGVGTISTIRGNRKYVDLARLSSSTIAWRQEAMDQLMKQSVYMNHVDVQPQDQLLLLVTCVDDSTERRVLIARRIRDGESIDALRRQVANNWNK